MWLFFTLINTKTDLKLTKLTTNLRYIILICTLSKSVFSRSTFGCSYSFESVRICLYEFAHLDTSISSILFCSFPPLLSPCQADNHPLNMQLSSVLCSFMGTLRSFLSCPACNFRCSRNLLSTRHVNRHS